MYVYVIFILFFLFKIIFVRCFCTAVGNGNYCQCIHFSSEQFYKQSANVETKISTSGAKIIKKSSVAARERT